MDFASNSEINTVMHFYLFIYLFDFYETII